MTHHLFVVILTLNDFAKGRFYSRHEKALKSFKTTIDASQEGRQKPSLSSEHSGSGMTL